MARTKPKAKPANAKAKAKAGPEAATRSAAEAREHARRVAQVAAETARVEALDLDCTDADVMCEMRDEFGISIGKVGKIETAGDAYEILVAKLKARVPADAWPRLCKILSKYCGRAITAKDQKLRGG
jgi:hypothetical protein